MKTLTATIAIRPARHLLLTLLAGGLTMLGAKANHNNSALHLKMFDNGMFSVVIDNNSACSQSNVFSAASIQPGCHKLKVIRYFQNPYSYYPISKVVYKGWITIPPKSVMYAQINCHSQFDVVKVEPYFCPPFGSGCSNDDWDDEYSHGYEGNGWGNSAPPAPVRMSQMEFMQLKNSIGSKAFEDSRLQIAKQALSYNYFSSAQIAELMHLFSFESSRLEFAKFAYGKTIDKQNYYLVNDAFSFENSIGELNQYIAMGK